MARHIHLHLRDAQDYGTPEGARKRAMHAGSSTGGAEPMSLHQPSRTGGAEPTSLHVPRTNQAPTHVPAIEANRYTYHVGNKQIGSGYHPSLSHAHNSVQSQHGQNAYVRSIQTGKSTQKLAGPQPEPGRAAMISRPGLGGARTGRQMVWGPKRK